MASAEGANPRGGRGVADDIEALKKENAQLQERLFQMAQASFKRAAPAPANAAEEERRLLEVFAARKAAEKSVPAIKAPDGTLSPAFAVFYGLNEDERTRLNAALGEAAQAEKRLNAEHTSVRAIDAETIEIVRLAYPEKGGAIHDRLAEEFKKVLGGGRYESFLALSARNAAGPFGNLGVRESTLVVKWDEPTKRYEAKESYRLGDYTGSTTAQVSTVAEIERLVPELGPLIPADMRARSGVGSP
jgi:hypothetical protein